MKNYFTDEQVEKIFRDSHPNQDEVMFIHLSEKDKANLKFLMNLAVEAAIGEPVAYTKYGELYGASYNTGLFWPKDCKNVPERADIKLYSVKELDN